MTRVAHCDIRAGKDDGLSDGRLMSPRIRKIEDGQRPMRARLSMGCEHGNAICALGELHRCGPSGVHLDGIWISLAGHEVDAIDSDHVKFLRYGPCERVGLPNELVIPLE